MNGNFLANIIWKALVKHTTCRVAGLQAGKSKCFDQACPASPGHSPLQAPHSYLKYIIYGHKQN